MRVSPTLTPHLVHRVRITLNGDDVTRACMDADDEAGKVLLLCGDPERHQDWRRSTSGYAHLMPDADDRPCVFTRRGRVVIQVT